MQPGAEPVRIAQPVQLGRRDQEGVEHRLGGFGPGERAVAGAVERRGVLVVRRGDAIRARPQDPEPFFLVGRIERVGVGRADAEDAHRSARRL